MELILQGIQKRFSEKEVLRDVSLCASGGKASGLLGRNGAGKTTTLRILMDVFPAGAGNVLFDGVPIDYEIVEIGYLREERGLYPNQQKIQLIIALSYDPQIVILDEPFRRRHPVCKNLSRRRSALWYCAKNRCNYESCMESLKLGRVFRFLRCFFKSSVNCSLTVYIFGRIRYTKYVCEVSKWAKHSVISWLLQGIAMR